MISLLLINFRSAALTAEAVRTAREGTSAPLQVVIVDNSCDPGEANALRDLGEVLIVSGSNRGYAGGINDGRRACRGETIIVSNPDVTFAAKALDLLADALGPSVAVAGPALFWDDAHQWRLPPGDLMTAPEKLDAILAGRSEAWRAQRDRRRFRQRVAFWSLARTTPVRMLSGAVMAIRSADFDEMGGFDERFALYFEENDFLRRVAARRKGIVYVPAAHCRHLYNQSAAQEGAAAAVRYAESQRKYLAKWNGPWLAGILERMERPPHRADLPSLQGAIAPGGSSVVVEVSPLATFATAAGLMSASSAVELPAEVRASAGGTPLYARVVERDTARVLAMYKITS